MSSIIGRDIQRYEDDADKWQRQLRSCHPDDEALFRDRRDKAWSAVEALKEYRLSLQH